MEEEILPTNETELARDIIVMIAKKYKRDGVSLIIVCVDVDSRSFNLRHILVAMEANKT